MPEKSPNNYLGFIPKEKYRMGRLRITTGTDVLFAKSVSSIPEVCHSHQTSIKRDMERVLESASACIPRLSRWLSKRKMMQWWFERTDICIVPLMLSCASLSRTNGLPVPLLFFAPTSRCPRTHSHCLVPCACTDNPHMYKWDWSCY